MQRAAISNIPAPPRLTDREIDEAVKNAIMTGRDHEWTLRGPISIHEWARRQRLGNVSRTPSR